MEQLLPEKVCQQIGLCAFNGAEYVRLGIPIARVLFVLNVRLAMQLVYSLGSCRQLSR